MGKKGYIKPNLAAAIKQNFPDFDEDAFLRNVGLLSPIMAAENSRNLQPTSCQSTIDLAISSSSSDSDSSGSTHPSQNKSAGQKMDPNIDYDEAESCLEPFVLLTQECEKSHTKSEQNETNNSNFEQREEVPGVANFENVESMEVSHETQEAANILMNELCNDIENMEEEEVEPARAEDDEKNTKVPSNGETQNVTSDEEGENNVTVVEFAIENEPNAAENNEGILRSENNEQNLQLEQIDPNTEPEKLSKTVQQHDNLCDVQKLLDDQYKCIPSSSSGVSRIQQSSDLNAMRNDITALAAELQQLKEFIQTMMTSNTDTTK